MIGREKRKGKRKRGEGRGERGEGRGERIREGNKPRISWAVSICQKILFQLGEGPMSV